MAGPRTKAKAGAAKEEPPAQPPYYVATADLHQGAAVDLMAVCAFRAGDHVPADVRDTNPEWQQWLVTPEEAEAASAAEEDQAPPGATTGAGSGQGEE